MFSDWRDLLSNIPSDEIDAVIIATQDTMHKGAILETLKKNVHILCEKPIVTNPKDADEIIQHAKDFSKVFVVSHVLRFSPFYTRVKEILSRKEIGDLIGIEMSENVGHIHMSHSYVRGQWSNSEKSSPMILAKSCHDMDILLYLTESNCESLSSYGDLYHFKKENAPVGATPRCTEGCPHVKTCPYAAQKIYLGDNIGWPVSVITTDLSIEGRLKALREGPWGSCVYHCDNNVVDHQTVNAKFQNGVIATFTMSGFTMKTHRSLRLMGTEGELIGDMEDGIITIHHFGSRDTKNIKIDTKPEGHSGSDELFVGDFVRYVKSNSSQNGTGLHDALQSHYMAFAAEESRLNNGKSMNLN
jgi:predicted dehydrogenase